MKVSFVNRTRLILTILVALLVVIVATYIYFSFNTNSIVNQVTITLVPTNVSLPSVTSINSKNELPPLIPYESFPNKTAFIRGNPTSYINGLNSNDAYLYKIGSTTYITTTVNPSGCSFTTCDISTLYYLHGNNAIKIIGDLSESIENYDYLGEEGNAMYADRRGNVFTVSNNGTTMYLIKNAKVVGEVNGVATLPFELKMFSDNKHTYLIINGAYGVTKKYEIVF